MQDNLDWNNRHLIENDTNSNYFVEAGAGSGKTTELVARMVSMVENGVNGQDIDISHICAITFTKAAANEFYDRFQKALMESDSPKTKEALKNIDLCFMGTIDSFTNMIISEHPAEANVPADSTVVDTQEMQEIWISYLKDIANGNYGKSLQDKYKLFIKFCKEPDAYFISALDFLMNTKNVKFQFNKPLSGCISQIFKDEIVQIKEALSFLVGDDIRVLNSTKGDQKAVYFAKLLLKLCDNFEVNFNSIMSCMSKIWGKYGLRFDKSVDLDSYPGAPQYVREIFCQSLTPKGQPSYWIINPPSDADNPFFRRDFDNYVYSIVADFVFDCRDFISQDLKAQGKLSYSDYLYYLKETLSKDAKSGGKLINHIYGRHKYFLIDEFQDTDPIQAEVFFYLTASNLNDVNSWKDCIPYPGSLFIVGDPKQSIYRFRNADVSSYLNVKNLFNNPKVGKVLELKQNFRSYEPVCSWFNDAFSDILIDVPGIQSAYEDIPLDNKKEYKGSIGGAYKQVYFGNKIKSSPATKNLCTIINELVDNDKFTVEDPPRKIQYGDIMIITYKKTHLKYYMDSFRENNIPYWVEGNVLFDDCPSLKCLNALVGLILDPNNIKSKVVAELLTKSNLDVDKLDYYKKKSLFKPASAFISLLIDKERIIAQYGTKNLEYLYYAVELVRADEQDSKISCLSDAHKFLSLLVSGEADLERCLQFSQNNNSVHIANLHKVKGLQAPVVIMTEAKMRDKDPQKHVNYMCDEAFSVMFNISGSGFGGGVVNWDNPQEKEIEANILDAEKDRLLYVAATRAKSVFIASDFKKKTGDGICSDNQAIPLLNKIDRDVPIGDKIDDDGTIIVDNPHNNVSYEIISDRSKVDTLFDRASDDCVLNKQVKHPTYQFNKPSDLDNDKQILKDFSDDAKIKVPSRNNAKFIGTIVHRLMELIVNARDFDGGHEKFIDAVIDEYSLDDEDLIKPLYNAANHIGDLLDKLKGASEIYCELPFYYKEGESITNGIIDLIYKDNESWHIIDYKTNADDCNLEQKYKSQLDSYRYAFNLLTGKDASAKILHLKV